MQSPSTTLKLFNLSIAQLNGLSIGSSHHIKVIMPSLISTLLPTCEYPQEQQLHCLHLRMPAEKEKVAVELENYPFLIWNLLPYSLGTASYSCICSEFVWIASTIINRRPIINRSPTVTAFITKIYILTNISSRICLTKYGTLPEASYQNSMFHVITSMISYFRYKQAEQT